MKRFMIIAVALCVGLFLTVLCTPYAKAHREDPTLWGGEMAFPILTVAIGAWICTKVKVEKRVKKPLKERFWALMDKILYKPAPAPKVKPVLYNYVIKDEKTENTGAD